MGDTTVTASPEPVETEPTHDHAWRRVEGPIGYGTVGEYRCDLCPAVWSM